MERAVEGRPVDAADNGLDRAEAWDAAKATVRALTPKTVQQFARARKVVPDGFTRARFFWPSPVYMDHGEGSHIFDIDGREYVDCLMGFGAMLLGHCHPAVREALVDQLGRGTQFGTAVRQESELAELIVENVPGAEQAMFLNSGTEATTGAVRLALAATGRRKVAKFEGGWHGWGDWLLHSSHAAQGPPESPETVIDTLGISESIRGDLVTLPFNHAAAIELIRRDGDELACVVLEGVLGSAGAIPAEPEWAREISAACKQKGIVLVLDEVITGFRLGRSGVAGLLGVEPDLTTLGKAIGGGLPVGAICGREDLMRMIIPNPSGERVLLAGTFSANPLSLTAGLATLRTAFADGGIYDHFNSIGGRLRDGLTEVMDNAGVSGTTSGLGPMWGLHLETDRPPTNVRESAGFVDTAAYPLAGYLLTEGVLMQAPIHQGFLSAAHTEADIDAVLEAHSNAFERMKSDGLLPNAT